MSLNHDNYDINKNILNRITYLINKRLSNFNLNKIDNIYENTKTLINEYEKQNTKLNNKISVLENLMILMNKDINELKRKIKSNKKENDELIFDEKVIDKNINKTKKESKINKISKNENEELLLETPVELNKVNSFTINEMNYKELKREEIKLDEQFVKKCLESHNLSSDLKVFKKIYIDDKPNSYYPIRHIKGNYTYWLNDKMNIDDENGSYIKETIITNLSNIYLNVNSFENYTDDNDLFIKNQEYIVNMSKQKYKDKLFKNILKIIEV